jgi:lipopolysaccharide/colanic/teichoic acid biosynthesis glycosyltransferase
MGDCLSASILIGMVMPLMAIVALAIKLDSPGPVFSRQQRLDFAGRRAQLLRFRTTVYRAEAYEARWRLGGELTRVGRFLRWTRVDELPLLFNVLCGDLTLFGAERSRRGLFE